MLSKKRRFHAESMGTNVAYGLFVMFLNPINRGPNFTWASAKKHVESMADVG